MLAPKFNQFRFIFVDVEELDITNAGEVAGFFSQHTFFACINCAAYTAVDRAESQPAIAAKVNVDGVRNLAVGCSSQGIPILQLSTDYVYHNSQNVPFKEGGPTDPKGVYAQTKLDGDKIALANGGMVIRTSWVYSSFGNNFVKTMLRLGNERKEIGVLFDQIGTPTYARDLALAMLTILEKYRNQEIKAGAMTGVYHYSNEGVTSWFDFAKAIFELKKMKVKVLPIETKDYPTPAQRPPFSVLNKNKIKAVFKLEIPYWRDSLKACLHKMVGERKSD